MVSKARALIMETSSLTPAGRYVKYIPPARFWSFFLSSENDNTHTKYNRDTDDIAICWTSLSFYKLLLEQSKQLIKKNLNCVYKIF